jgi:KTSC domain-containing protein
VARDIFERDSRTSASRRDQNCTNSGGFRYTLGRPASVCSPRALRRPHSRTIRAATYDADTEHLTVQFVSGSTYGYDHVSEERWTRFAEAPSKGHFFGQHIRPQHAHSTKAGDVPIAVEI